MGGSGPQVKRLLIVQREVFTNQSLLRVAI